MTIDKDTEAVVFAQLDANLDTNPKIRKAGCFGRQVYEFVLRRNALRGSKGSVPIAFVDPDYLADLLMIARDDAMTGVTKAVTANLIAIDYAAGLVRIVGWHESWGRRAKEGKERTREWRDRKRLEEQEPVTTGDGGDVTPSHVTVSDESDVLDQIREEKKIPDTHAARAIVQPASWQRRKAWWDCMVAAFDRLRKPTATRAAIKPNTADLAKHPNEPMLLACERFLREGGYDADGIDAKMRHVVLVHEAEAEAFEHLDFFKPALIWDTTRPDRFPRKVDTPLEEARRAGPKSRATARRSGDLIGPAAPRTDHPDKRVSTPISEIGR